MASDVVETGKRYVLLEWEHFRALCPVSKAGCCYHDPFDGSIGCPPDKNEPPCPVFKANDAGPLLAKAEWAVEWAKKNMDTCSFSSLEAELRKIKGD